MKTLELSARTNGEFKTRASIVFIPLEQKVIICSDGNYHNIWKINITKNTIEYCDVDNIVRSITISKHGILKSEMLRLQNEKFYIGIVNLRFSCYVLLMEKNIITALHMTNNTILSVQVVMHLLPTTCKQKNTVMRIY